MSKESQRAERWKQQATEGMTYQKELYEALVEQKVTRYSQAPDDLPGELIAMKEGVEHKCRMCLEYDNFKQDAWPWFVRYRDVETNEIIMEASSTCWDNAIGNMMNHIKHNWRGSREEIKLIDGSIPHVFLIGSCHNIHEYSQIDRFYKLKSYKMYDSTNIDEKPIKLIDINCCPYCGSKNYLSEYYKSSPESWVALAGREGYKRVCQDCGYVDNEIICMS